MIRTTLITIAAIFLIASANAQIDPLKPDPNEPAKIEGMKLVWNDEFNIDGKPDTTKWSHEEGFKRNKELQWYQLDNANCSNGVLVIEGRREKKPNPDYVKDHKDWQKNREFAEYTSSCLVTKDLASWQYGRFEIRAKLDTSKGSWPAIWTLGNDGEWPSNGEIDILEFYIYENISSILANVAWGTDKRWVAKWDSEQVPRVDLVKNDPEWPNKFHTWAMDWTEDSILLYCDDVLLNSTALSETINPDGKNPFKQPHFLLLNLALGSNGGDPSNTKFPINYEVDYVRVYQKE